MPEKTHQRPSLWHVAHVETSREIDIATEIHDRLGLLVFVPAARVWASRRGRRFEACRPLFDGYIFPRVDHAWQDWSRLRTIDGVFDVLGAPRDCEGIPAHVSAMWVEAMQRAQDAGAFDRTKPLPDGFAVGDSVRVTEGLFAGFDAEIVSFVFKMRSASARKRAKLLVQFMGQMCSAELDVTALEKI